MQSKYKYISHLAKSKGVPGCIEIRMSVVFFSEVGDETGFDNL